MQTAILAAIASFKVVGFCENEVTVGIDVIVLTFFEFMGRGRVGAEVSFLA